MGNGVQNRILIFITFITATTVLSDEYNVKKTWFGDPDLQGVWTNASLTTLERPDHFKTLEITDEAAEYAKKAFGVKSELAKQATLLCKADLVSEMVMEFPELQGIMGGHYAKIKNKSEEVS